MVQVYAGELIPDLNHVIAGAGLEFRCIHCRMTFLNQVFSEIAHLTAGMRLKKIRR
jgi:hypothetical protein